MNKKLKIAIIGSRGYPYVYSGYETLVKELSERLVKKGYCVRIYCHRSLFKKKPKFVNGIELVYTPSIETKFLSQFVNSFFSTIHFCFSNYSVGLYVNSANGPFGILTRLFGKKTYINVDGLEWLRPKWKGLGSLYFVFSSKLSTLFFNKIITDSFEMSKIYKSKFNVESNVIAYGPTMIKTTSRKVLDKFKISTNEYYLIVGRLIPDNNSELIIKGFLKSSSNKKLVVVGDVTYKDKYARIVKAMSSERVILTGYIKSNEDLSTLYINSFCYIHGHEFGGTNPTMVNALDLNCSILALKTKFNEEMLLERKTIFFKKDIENIKISINEFEKNFENLKKINKNYTLPLRYKWSEIVDQYLELFYKLIN